MLEKKYLLYLLTILSITISSNLAEDNLASVYDDLTETEIKTNKRRLDIIKKIEDLELARADELKKHPLLRSAKILVYVRKKIPLLKIDLEREIMISSEKFRKKYALIFNDFSKLFNRPLSTLPDIDYTIEELDFFKKWNIKSEEILTRTFKYLRDDKEMRLNRIWS